MANPEHLERLRSGVANWNTWVVEYCKRVEDREKIDLSGADLRGFSLEGVDLRGVNLTGADFAAAGLRLADLSDTNLRGSNFTEAWLFRANLSHANLRGADFRDAKAFAAVFNLAVLSRADLTRAELPYADFSYTDLTDAKLTQANLSVAYFRGASLAKCRFDRATCDSTHFAAVDLSTAKNLDTIRHHGLSHISIDTLYLSKGQIPRKFLLGAGVPETLIDYIASLTTSPLAYHSCFISHSHQDARFCDRLQDDLRNAGVLVWYFPRDARGGRAVISEIDRGIQGFDKLILVCSKDSLTSAAVLDEIERAIQREQRENREILFPIQIDAYLNEWEHPRKANIKARVYRNFRGAAARRTPKYEEALSLLIQDLKTENPAPRP